MLETPVSSDRFPLLGRMLAVEIPMWLISGYVHNGGNYIASLGNLRRWLAGHAGDMGNFNSAPTKVIEFVKIGK